MINDIVQLVWKDESFEKTEILRMAQDCKVRELNRLVQDIMEYADKNRKIMRKYLDLADVVKDEVRRRAEQMEARILATTDDLK